jgi:uncharacterized protein
VHHGPPCGAADAQRVVPGTRDPARPRRKHDMQQNANIELVKRCYEAFERGDINFILDAVAKDVDWEAVVGVGPRIPTGGRRRGRQEVEDFFAKLNETTRFDLMQPRDFVSDGERVLVLGEYRGVVQRTGRRFAADWVMLFRVREGRIIEFREFTDTAALLDAFGIAYGQDVGVEVKPPRRSADTSH